MLNSNRTTPAAVIFSETLMTAAVILYYGVEVGSHYLTDAALSPVHTFAAVLFTLSAITAAGFIWRYRPRRDDSGTQFGPSLDWRQGITLGRDARCPRCGGGRAGKVGFTWCGVLFAMISLRQSECQDCGTRYNSRSGEPMTPGMRVNAAVYAICLLLLFLIVPLALVAVKLDDFRLNTFRRVDFSEAGASLAGRAPASIS